MEVGGAADVGGLSAGDVMEEFGIVDEELKEFRLRHQLEAFISDAHAKKLDIVVLTTSPVKKKRGAPTKPIAKHADPKSSRKAAELERQKVKDIRAAATPEQKTDEALRRRVERENKPREHWEKERDRKQLFYHNRKDSGTLQGLSTRRSLSHMPKGYEAHCAKLNSSATSLHPVRPNSYVNDPGHSILSYQDRPTRLTRCLALHNHLNSKDTSGLNTVPFPTVAFPPTRQVLDYDYGMTRDINRLMMAPPSHDEMLQPQCYMESSVVRAVIDELAERLSWRDDLYFFPFDAAVMVTPDMPLLPVFNPPISAANPRTLIAVVYIGPFGSGHYVTVSVCRSGDLSNRNVHVFDPRFAFTLDSPNTGLYRHHLAKVGATLLGDDGSMGVNLIWHTVVDQGATEQVQNGCGAFSILFAAALAFSIDPSDLIVPMAHEEFLRRRIHDFYFTAPQGGVPSLTPLRRALEVATQRYHDDDIDADSEVVACPMCPNNESWPIDIHLHLPSLLQNAVNEDMDQSTESIELMSISDDCGNDPVSDIPPTSTVPSTSTPQQKHITRKAYASRTKVATKRKLLPETPVDVPPLKRPNVSPDKQARCPYCGSWLLASEAGSLTGVKTQFCCAKGELLAPGLLPFECDFYTEGKFVEPAFRDNSRLLNGMAAMASTGIHVKYHSFRPGTHGYVKVEGRIYHELHNLQEKQHHQMCIVDSSYRETFSRRESLDPSLTAKVFEYLDQSSTLYRQYRKLGSEPSENASVLFQKVTRRSHGNVLGDVPLQPQQNLMPVCDEIAAILSNDPTAGPRDVRVWASGDVRPKTISYMDPAYEALAFPLLRPHAEASWEFTMRGPNGRKISLMHYMRQMILTQPRMWELGKLGQEAAVDGFCRIENERLGYIKRNQVKLRMGSRDEVTAALGEDPDGVESLHAGREVIILPATFTNSPRNLKMLYHDAMRIVGAKGKPTFFITFTCNPKWPEITGITAEEMAKEVPGSRKRKCEPERSRPASDTNRPINCPGTVARAFNSRLHMMMGEIRSGGIFGCKTSFDLVCIEFQKRGLPHAHILVRLVDDLSQDEIDQHISARIPGLDQPELRQKVLTHMIHGPCGAANYSSPCMDAATRTCTKHYPMPECESTHVDERGYPHYRRSKTNTATIKKGWKQMTVNDTNVVPHNVILLQRFDAHINVEFASTARTVKYLFKYVMKGPDMTRAAVAARGTVLNEVHDYENHRIIGAAEACWRIFGFEMHSRSVAVICLNVHEPDKDQIIYNPTNPAPALARPSRFDRYMNRPVGPEFDRLTFCAYFEVWKEGAHPNKDTVPHPNGINHIHKRKRGEMLARLNWVSQGMTERFFLRMIVAEFPVRSHRDILTVNGKTFTTYYAAAKALGLADDDREFFTAIREAHGFLPASQLRSFFVTILMGETRTPAPALWKEFADAFAEDFLLRESTERAHVNALLHISRLLSLHGRSLKDFALPEVEDLTTELGRELIRYSVQESQLYVDTWKSQFNDEQRGVVDEILSRFPPHFAVSWPNSSTAASSRLRNISMASPSTHETMILLAPGGCGKTALLKFLACHLRLLGEVVVCAASTGIAACNLPGGITAHSAFKLPFDSTDPEATSHLSMNSQRADLLRRTSLIVYDEIAMVQRNTFRSFQRVMTDLRSRCLRVVLLCGDYAQIPPIVKNGTKGQILQASTRFVPEWDTFPLLRLSRNMRAIHDPVYSDMVQRVGRGTMETIRIDDQPSTLTRLPLVQLIPSRDELIKYVYPRLDNSDDCLSRAILSGTNEGIDKWNSDILSRLPGEDEIFLSADSCVEEGTTNGLQMSVDALGTFTDTGVPPHKLILKKGAVVILMRNLNFDAALCTSVKGIVHDFSPSRRIVYIRIPKEGGKPGEGAIHGIPRIIFRFSPAGKGMEVSRRQFPLRLAWALTFNKSQGQTLSRVGVDLMSDVFAHGHLYVVLSRVRDRDSIRAMTRPQRILDGCLLATNIVYPELVVDHPLILPHSPRNSPPPSPEFHGGAMPDDQL